MSDATTERWNYHTNRYESISLDMFDDSGRVLRYDQDRDRLMVDANFEAAS